MTSFTSKALLSKLRKAKKGKKLNGFTLIELMVVVAIIGVLTAVGLPKMTDALSKADDAAAAATLENAVKDCSFDLISSPSSVRVYPIEANAVPGQIYGPCAKGGTMGIKGGISKAIPV